MTKKIRWGIIGPGKIAHKFAADLVISNDSVLYGVASRDLDKAKAFGEKYGATTYYSSYEQLAEDPEIDVIYIATPHVFHYQNTMMCLKKGKAVLCEKPMGINSDQVEEMLQEAAEQQVFLMEAIWTRFIPATEKVLALLEQNAIGDVLFVHADFGFKGDGNLESRIYNKKLGGGSLLDIGIYPIYLSLLILGIPTDIKAMARMTATEVDSYCSMLFNYSNNSKAILESTIEANTPTEACIYGSEGTIKLHGRFHHANKITLTKNGVEEVFDIGYEGNGYFYEIEEVNNCLRQGLTQSSKLPFKLSLDLIKLIDRVKNEIGLKY